MEWMKCWWTLIYYSFFSDFQFLYVMLMFFLNINWIPNESRFLFFILSRKKMCSQYQDFKFPVNMLWSNKQKFNIFLFREFYIPLNVPNSECDYYHEYIIRQNPKFDRNTLKWILITVPLLIRLKSFGKWPVKIDKRSVMHSTI